MWSITITKRCGHDFDLSNDDHRDFAGHILPISSENSASYEVLECISGLHNDPRCPIAVTVSAPYSIRQVCCQFADLEGIEGLVSHEQNIGQTNHRPLKLTRPIGIAFNLHNPLRSKTWWHDRCRQCNGLEYAPQDSFRKLSTSTRSFKVFIALKFYEALHAQIEEGD
ncbi:hypothetical protein KIN20_010012 [Parelaphostrongylus tenuis]|uniref:Uncharacterized protein n=1 Tax=Parelaphostrongylus tenuis TaxID=148309 RepID=A0AAD5QNT8_PARTN|nr:hypothetical protein KIN20_010012 [Parelaphostrongylus tenuis]